MDRPPCRAGADHRPAAAFAVRLALYAIGSSEQSAYMTGARVDFLARRRPRRGLLSALACFYLSMVTLHWDAASRRPTCCDRGGGVGGVALTGGVGSPLGAAIVVRSQDHLVADVLLRPPLAQPFFEGLILAVAISAVSGRFRFCACAAASRRSSERRFLATRPRIGDRPVDARSTAVLLVIVGCFALLGIGGMINPAFLTANYCRSSSRSRR